jgi:hypothetical protein
MNVSEWPALPYEDWREKRDTLNVYRVGVDNREAAVGSLVGRCVRSAGSTAGVVVRDDPHDSHHLRRDHKAGHPARLGPRLVDVRELLDDFGR